CGPSSRLRLHSWRRGRSARSPDFPIVRHSLSHGHSGLVQPIPRPPSQVAPHSLDPICSVEVDVRCLPAHLPEQASLVALLGQLGKLNPTTIRRQPPHDPPAAAVQERVLAADCSTKNYLVTNLP